MSEYRLEIRIRNARVLRAMEAAGLTSVVALCQAMGMNKPSGIVYQLINFKVSPMTKAGSWRPIATRLSEALDTSCEDLFPDASRELLLDSNVRYMTMAHSDVARLFGGGEAPLLPDEALSLKETKDGLAKALGRLGSRERAVLKMRFGLDGQREHTLEEVGHALNVTRERVRQIESKALRKLRHPDWRRVIEGHVDSWRSWPEVTDKDRLEWAARVLEARSIHR